MRSMFKTLTKKIVQPNIQIYEITTVLILFCIACAFARPELETWGVFEAFRVLGVDGGLKQLFIGNPARLFEPVPLALAWVLGHGAVWALGFVFGLELVAKYLIARWAISPLVSDTHRWILATLAAVMLPWAGQWHGHNMAQQLSTVFMFAALGAVLRLRERTHIGWMIFGIMSVVFSLFSYEALLLCAFALPLVVLFSDRGPLLQNIRPAIRAMFVVISGMVIYGLYFYMTLRFSGGSKGYHEFLVSGPSPWKVPLKLFAYLYKTAYTNSLGVTALLIAVLALLVGSVSRRTMIMLGVMVLLLPLFSLSYAVNFYFLSDIERVGLPLGVAFFLLCVVAVIRFSSEPQHQWRGFLIVAIVLVWAGVDAYKSSYRPYALQRTVLDQTKALVRANQAKFVLIQDWTGRLGDSYSFYVPDTLPQAMAVEGVPVDIQLCTPKSVTRHHPMMKKFQGTSGIPLCEDLPVTSTPRLVLDFRKQENVKGFPVLTSLGIMSPSPPSNFKIGPEYPVGEPISGLVRKRGFSKREPWGQWSDGMSSEFILMIDRDELAKYKSGFINFKVLPFLFKSTQAQNISITWGKGKYTRTRIRGKAWISIPYTQNDWSKTKIREMTIKFEFPNAVSQRESDPTYKGTLKLAIGFQAISVTEHPLGRLL